MANSDDYKIKQIVPALPGYYAIRFCFDPECPPEECFEKFPVVAWLIECEQTWNPKSGKYGGYTTFKTSSPITTEDDIDGMYLEHPDGRFLWNGHGYYSSLDDLMAVVKEYFKNAE